MNNTPNTVTGHADPAREQRARQYERLHNWLFLADVAVSLALLALLIAGGERSLSFRIEEAVRAVIGENRWLVVAGYVTVVLVSYTVLFLPYSWWKGYYLERRFELGTQTFRSWLWDEVKSLALSLALAIVVFEAFYWLLRTAGGMWWLWAAGVWIVLQVVLGMLFPVVIIPLFYKTERLHDPELEAQVGALAARAGVTVLGMFRVGMAEKTKKANAALAGLGATKRILFADTLLEHFPRGEITSVLAHEFGHYYHRHILKLIVIASLSAVVGMSIADLVLNAAAGALGITDMARIATAPLLILALFLFSLVTMPLMNNLSRYFERQADEYALDCTRDADAFIAAMRRLADQNLADKEPHPVIESLLHSHPSIGRRIRFAEEWNARQGRKEVTDHLTSDI